MNESEWLNVFHLVIQSHIHSFNLVPVVPDYKKGIIRNISSCILNFYVFRFQSKKSCYYLNKNSTYKTIGQKKRLHKRQPFFIERTILFH